MFTKFMFTDEWQDRADHGIGIASPTLNQVKQAIASLDGKRRTIVLLSEKDGCDAHMGVSGRWGRDFMVYATKDNRNFFSLVDSTRSSDKVMLYVGGQDGEYEERKCVPLTWALEAAEYFCETGELKSTMNWVRD